MKVERVAALGAGVQGASWTILFLASGREVIVFDPKPQAETSGRALAGCAALDFEPL